MGLSGRPESRDGPGVDFADRAVDFADQPLQEDQRVTEHIPWTLPGNQVVRLLLPFN